MSYYLLDHPNPNIDYPQYRQVRRRSPATPTGTVIMHTAQGWGAHAVARFISTRTGWGSYHRLCDWDTIIKMAPFSYETWQDSETNPWGIGISAAVYAEGWDGMDPDKRDRTYRNLAACAAEAVTYMRDTHGVIVPLHRITGAEARAGVPGFCAHGDSGLYRTDPGVQFNWKLFFDYTRQALGGLASMGTTEEDDMAAEDIKYLRDKAARAEQLLLSFQAVLTDPVSGYIGKAAMLTLSGGNPSLYIKGKGDATIYAHNIHTGELRGLTKDEWAVIHAAGGKYIDMEQKLVSDLLKIAAKKDS